jgi:hypothetical protein
MKYVINMSTITVILDPQPDGTLHLPIPDELKNSKIKLVATLERAGPVEKPGAGRKAGSLTGKIWMAPDFDAPLEDFKDHME